MFERWNFETGEIQGNECIIYRYPDVMHLSG